MCYNYNMAKSLDIIDPKKELGPETPETEGEKKQDEFEENKGGGAFYLVIGIIAVVVAVASALYILYRDTGNKKTNDSNAAQTTASTTPTETAAASSVASAAAVETALQSATSSAFKYTDESIRIVNGNGINGEAAKIKKLLEDKGYKIASVANASRNYDSTIVYYKSGQQALAEALKNEIKDSYTAEIQESDSVVGSYDAIIALGAK